MVNLLVHQPLRYVTVSSALDLVTPDTASLLKLAQPSVHQLRGVVIEGEQKAREHSRGRAKPSEVVGLGPEENEGQPRIARYLAEGFGKGGFWFDGSDAGHQCAVTK